MTTAFLFGLPALVLSGALMFLLPQFAPRRFFFAITVTPEFRSSSEARAIARRYHHEMTVALIGSAALAALLARAWPDLSIMFFLLLPLVSGFALFLMARSKVRRIAPAQNDVREAELTAEGDHLPRWTLWALPPFAFPVAVAAYVHQHWNEIPERYPSHWDLEGNINGWSTRTPGSVYGVLAIAPAIMLLLLLIGAGMFYGARRAPQRAAVLKMLICCMYFLALVFTPVGLMPLVHISVVWFVLLAPLFTVGILVWSFKLLKDPCMPSEATPDACWYLGSVYWNRGDPAIFVQKRVGFGYTFNFGNPMTWLLIGGFVAGMLGLIAVAK